MFRSGPSFPRPSRPQLTAMQVTNLLCEPDGQVKAFGDTCTMAEAANILEGASPEARQQVAYLLHDSQPTVVIFPNVWKLIISSLRARSATFEREPCDPKRKIGARQT